MATLFPNKLFHGALNRFCKIRRFNAKLRWTMSSTTDFWGYWCPVSVSWRNRFIVTWCLTVCRALSCFKSWASLGFSARWLCSLTEFRISWRISLSLASRTAILVTDLQASRARYLVEIQSWWCRNNRDGFVSAAKRTAQVRFRLRQITVHAQPYKIAPLLFQQRSCYGNRWRC